MRIETGVGDTPRVLGKMLEKGRPAYETVVRRTRWGEGPLHIVADGSSYPAALTGLYAFESLLGWPVVVNRPENFLAYSASLIRPRSVVLAISLSSEADKTLEAALQARSRGAALLALTTEPSSPLAGSADGTFLVQGGEDVLTNLQAELCLHAATGFASVVAAHVLQRHHPKLEELEAEYEKLPEHAERVLTRLKDATRSLGSHLTEARDLTVVGGGFYHPAAMQAARTLDKLTTVRAAGESVLEFRDSLAASRKPGHAAVLFLTGSRCRLKKEVHESARIVRQGEAKLFAVTDANDPELSAAASLAVLLPGLAEMTGSVLGLLFVQSLISHLSRITKLSKTPPL